VRIVSAMLPTPTRPQWAIIGPRGLACGYLGDEQALAYYEKTLPSSGPVEVVRRSLAEDVAERAAAWRTPVFRAAVPPAGIGEFVVRAGARHWSADAAFGAVRIYDEGIDAGKVQEAARAVGGMAWPEAGSLGTYGPVETELLKRLKAAFDPDGKLEPLPL
jgi:hypothetical protein